jgi:predicted DNA-binding transcriptional regulator AlpA
MNALTQFAASRGSTGQTLDPADLLTPKELAERLKVSVSWIFEQTRERAKVRNKNPLPCIRLGKYIRFSWVQVCEWMAQNNG